MKVHLAAYETQWCINMSRHHVDVPRDANLFVTFEYEKLCTRSVKWLKQAGHRGCVVVDSGAHTFFGYAGIFAISSYDKTGDKMPDPTNHFVRYVSWLKRHYHLIDYFVELDIQEIVGLDQVKYWRQVLKREGLWEKCIPCFHRGDSFDEYKALVEDVKDGGSSYIGLQGLRIGQESLPYTKLIKYAYENKVRVHGFAFTRSQLLQHLPFYSIDSSTWTMPIRYGTAAKFDEERGHIKSALCFTAERVINGGLPSFMHSSSRGPGLDAKKLLFEADEFMKMERHLTELWLSRGIDWEKQLSK